MADVDLIRARREAIIQVIERRRAAIVRHEQAIDILETTLRELDITERVLVEFENPTLQEKWKTLLGEVSDEIIEAYEGKTRPQRAKKFLPPKPPGLPPYPEMISMAL